MDSGFRFLLMLPDGEPADPAAFNTVIPTWHVGDEFLAGSELRMFRIVAIEPEMDEALSREVQGYWVVEPVV